MFDSTDHPLSFFLNRINNFYTWIILLPVCGYIILWPTIQIRRVLRAAMEQGIASFEILHSDRAGGYMAFENAKVVFNAILAMIYIDVSLHTGTFRVAHFDHIAAYCAATIVLLFGNFIIFRNVNACVRSLREVALESRRRRVYEDDRLSFEILRFAYQARPPHVLANLLIKGVPIVSSLVLKLVPLAPLRIGI